MEFIPRLDRLPLSRWHIALVIILGVSWIFDGFEVSSLSLCSSSIKTSLSVENSQFYLISTFYMVGCAVGGLVFGFLSYFIGRKQIFIATLLIYATSIVLILLAQSLTLVIISRFVAGLSIGGQYTAIFAAIDEFIPAPYRGRVGIIVDGSWHLGGITASLLSLSLNTANLWKFMFGLGLIGILPIIVLRRYIPESPRWLVTKQREEQAANIVCLIEQSVRNKNYFITRDLSSSSQSSAGTINLTMLFKSLLRTVVRYPRRMAVAAFLIYSQAFFFNSLYYKYPLILESLGVKENNVGKYMVQLSIVSFLGPVTIGPLFDKIGRRIMCLATFGIAGIMLIILQNLQNNLTVLHVFMVILFFISSPAASSANLTASELFPTESRSLILSIMFMIGMFGGISGVWVQQFLVSGILMVCAGVIGCLFGVNAQNKSLEEIQVIN